MPGRRKMENGERGKRHPAGRRQKHQFVGSEERVVQPLPATEALDHSQVDRLPGQRLLDLPAVAREHGDPHPGVTGRKVGQNRRQQVLGDGRAGTQPQLALGMARAEAHLVLQPAVVLGQALGRRQHRAPGIGQGEPAAAAHEQRRAVACLQLADVLADGRLRNVELLGGPRETQRPGRRNEYFQSEIVHRLNRDDPPRRTRGPNGCSGRWSPPSRGRTCRRRHSCGRRR